MLNPSSVAPTAPHRSPGFRLWVEISSSRLLREAPRWDRGSQSSHRFTFDGFSRKIQRHAVEQGHCVGVRHQSPPVLPSSSIGFTSQHRKCLPWEGVTAPAYATAPPASPHSAHSTFPYPPIRALRPRGRRRMPCRQRDIAGRPDDHTQPAWEVSVPRSLEGAS